MMMMRLRPVFAVLAVLAMGVFVGCSDDDDDNGTTPTPSLEVQVQATPAQAQTGGTIGLTAQVSATKVDYTYVWSATAGTFTSTNTATTNWTAPDEDGTYEITCVVSDGTNAAVGKRSVVASEYLPPVSPHYVGAATCSGCHGDVHTAWSGKSGHAGAYASLVEEGMGGNTNCIGCHSVGYITGVANGGYDEQKVERLQNVQCENCHGPGSAHAASPAGGLPIDTSAALCGSCHEGEHHPTYTEWQDSPHGNPAIASPAGRNGCAHCHNGAWADEYLDDPTHVFTGAPTDTLSIECAVCHDPHGNDNHSNLRNAVNDIALPDGLHPDAGAGRLCIACHNGRRTPESVEGQIENGTGHFGPHHSCQGDMLAGTGAYEDVNPSFSFRASNHLRIQDGCVNCHTHHVATELPFYTGHTFQPTTAACAQCHGPIEAFTDIIAKDDYDGDAAVEGVQLEVEGLLERLAETIIAATPLEEDRLELEAAYLEGTLSEVVGDTLKTTRAQRASAYNLFFVEFDHSRGVHNSTYAIQLLQQSILALEPGALKDGKILVE
jgi:hypothetical protein